MLARITIAATLLFIAACSESGDTVNSAVIENDQPLDPSVVFLNQNGARDEVTVTESGLQYEVLKATDGPKPAADSLVTVHYVGRLIDNTVFDSSLSRGQAATFSLSSVIQGWTEGLQLMGVGSYFRFYIPAHLAYGNRGSGQIIGPGETLVFDVELLEINS